MDQPSKRSSGNSLVAHDAPAISMQEFELLRDMIKKITGISLAPAKRDLVRTRLRKRLVELGLASYGDYYNYLRSSDRDGKELSEMVNCITTNKTDFFRESHHFDFLNSTALPAIIERAKRGGPKKLRIWSAGCSTGEEPYTIALTLREAFKSLPGWDLKILASDIDSNCLAKASAGVYDEDRIDDIPLDLKRRYFLKGTGESAGKVSVRPELRSMITFRRINFANHPWPIQTKFDIIFCRNVMIYFERDFQQSLLENFVRYLSPEGYLILGHSENVSWLGELLQPLGKTIYRPLANASNLSFAKGEKSPSSNSPSTHSPTAPGATPSTTSSLRKAASSYMAPQNRTGDKAPESKSTAKRIVKQVVGAPIVKSANRPAANSPSHALRAKTGVEPVGRKAIVAGEVFASDDSVEISTLLGSCIAACLYDPVAKAGGMNHFLLPEGSGPTADTACYGINAMELLINELMKLGGDRSRLVAKLFGGARVLRNELQQTRVGQKNTDFVRKYLTTEGIPIVSEQVCGEKALRVYMLANTGEVVAQELDPSAERQLAARETTFAAKAQTEAANGPEEQIVLF